MDERHPLAVAGGLINKAAGSFIARHGDQAQVIKLPKGEFMLRAGNEVFSSLNPGKQIKVVNLGTGRDFYQHDNYIISTVGLDPETGELAEHVNNMGVAFSNHWGMTRPPADYQKEMAKIVAYGFGVRGGEVPRNPQDISMADIAAMAEAGVIGLDGQNSNRLHNLVSYTRGPLDKAWSEDFRMRARDFHPWDPYSRYADSFGNFDVVHGNEIKKYSSDQLRSLEQFVEVVNLAGSQMVPNRKPVNKQISDVGGIFQAFMPDHTTRMNAHLKQVQIVPHPEWLIPHEMDYGGELVVFRDIMGDKPVVVDWPFEGKEPARINFEVYPVPYKAGDVNPPAVEGADVLFGLENR